MTIERHPAVIERDLPDIYAYIARDNPAPAERVLDAIAATFAEIGAQPECGVAYPTRTAQLTNLRMLPVNRFTNYLVFYRIERETVRILYVVHGARHLPSLFRRDSRR